MYYTYVYLDPRKPGTYSYENNSFDHEPFYVGKGSNNRSKDHLHPSALQSNTPKTAKINKLKSLGLEPIIIIVENYNDEDDAYLAEKSLIESIGSEYIEGIPDGPLTNMIFDAANPPCHKGKTYLEIYGSPEEAERQRAKRHANQIAAGGYFKGGKHSDETKACLSEHLKKSQENGGRRKGIKHDDASKEKMKLGHLNHMPHQAKGYILVSPTLEEFNIIRIKDFCNENELSLSTLKKTVHTLKPVSHGKTKGWLIKSSYTPTEEEWFKAKKKGA